MAEGNQTASPEAFERVTAQRDDFKTKLEDAQTKLAATTQQLAESLGREKFIEHRAGSDPAWKRVQAELTYAGAQLRTITDPEQIQTAVEQAAQFLDQFQTPAAAAPTGEGGTTEPSDPGKPETAVPGFPNVDPAAPGAAPRPEALKPGSVEVGTIVREGGVNALRGAVERGEVALSDEVKARHGI